MFFFWGHQCTTAPTDVPQPRAPTDVPPLGDITFSLHTSDYQMPVSCVLAQPTKCPVQPQFSEASQLCLGPAHQSPVQPRYQMPVSLVLVQPTRCPVQPPLSDANQLCPGPALQMSSTAPVIRCQSALSWSSPPDVQYSPRHQMPISFVLVQPTRCPVQPRYQMPVSLVLVQATRCPVQPSLSDDNQLCLGPAHQMSSTALAIR